MQTRKKLILFDSLKIRLRHICIVMPVGMLLASVAYAQNTSTSLSAANRSAAVIHPNAYWIHFPPRPGKSLPSASAVAGTTSDAAAQTSSPPAAPSTATPEDKSLQKASKASNDTPSVASNNEWVQFPPLPAPKPKAAAATDKQTADKPVTGNSKPVETSNNAQAPEASPALNTPPTPNNTEFKFKQFNFQGNTVYSETALRKLLAVTVPAVKDLNDLQRAAEVVANHYQDDGVLARVDLLPQDLTEGVVTMTITEGRFGGAKMETAESPKLPYDFLVKLVETAQPKNTAVRLPQMDRATLLLKEIPGVEASVRLSTGEVDGETRALVQVKDKKAYDGQFAVDNTGSTYTGAYRFSTQYNRYGLLGRADAANVQYMHSEGLDYLRLGYSEPLGYGGARWGMNTEFTKYQVIDSTFDALDLHGPSTGVNAYLSQPLVRDRNLSTDLVLSGDHKKYTNHSSISTSKYQLDSISASWQAVNQDLWLGGGENNASLMVARGLVNNDSTGISTEGYFTKWRLNLNRKQKVDAQHMLLTSYQRQWANRTLDSSEKFNIGGSNAVRAYPAGEASGTQASLLTIELQRDLDWNKQAYKFSAFYDLGDVTKEKASTSSTNAYKLQGLGLWLGASYPNKWGQSQWRVTWARRLGSNPGASNGNDSDGTYYLNRFWFSASQVF
jgi:hemolysin activation/secretion protein